MPDPATTAPASTPAPSPTPAAPSTPAPAPEQATRPTIAEVKTPSRPDPKVVSVREALGLSKSPREQVKKMTEELKKRVAPETFKPKSPANAPKPKPAPPVAAKPAENPEVDPDTLKPEPKPEPPAPAEKPKIKIGNEEKTAEEWEQHYADLQNKIEAKAQEKIEDPQKLEAPIKSEEDLDREFIESTAAEEGITAEEFDQAMAQGNPEILNRKIAQMRLADRKLNAQWAKGLRDEIAALRPALEMAEKVKQFEAEQAFATAFPDVVGHPEGKATREAVKAELAEHVNFLTWKRDNGKATPEDTAFLDLHAKDPNTLIAFNTRKRLGLDLSGKTQPAAPAPSPAPASVAAAPAQTRPAPPAGHRPGGAGTPQAVSPQQAIIAKARAGLGRI